MKKRLGVWPLFLALLMFVNCSRDNNPAGPGDSNVNTHEEIEQQIFNKINAYRVENGQSALSLRSVITQQARRHSQNMAAGTVEFSHNGFEARVSEIAKTIKLQSAAENVAYNKGYENPAQVAVDGWLQSEGHRKNIEGPYNLTGIGVAEQNGTFYFTQIFILSY